MTEIRVALFTGNYHHVRDGVSLTLNRLVAYLMENGVKVLVLGPTIENPALKHNGTLVPVPSIRLPGRPEYRITTSFPAEAQKELEQFSPTLVHIATPDLLGFKALKWAEKNEVPVVSSYHTHFTSYLKYYKLSLIEPFLWKYLKWFYARCRHLYVPTPSMAEWLKEKGVECELKIWARGIESSEFSPQNRDLSWRRSNGFEDDDLVITFVSRLVWEKNLRLFADVVKRLMEKYDNVKALIVGDGPAADELKKMFPEAVYAGFLKGENLSKAYAGSDIFFFPSDTETFGNVTLEAMASGLPCVVANAAGSKSLVQNSVNGYLLPVEEPEAFYTALEKLILDDQLREEMGEKSVDMAQNYSWESINGKLLEYYRQVV
ncbi:glycosyltransferase family 4 protein [Rhodohalobacter mucosus]|uniref:Glycosyltransferase family 1 protein n=1 Tax=Rhodohalobacter mucosus TaxID=2079485 RepID=A0A316TS73_9BACT|nr:glycosyltransferase family 1 protein [Rhodohalobacter mucosus]PWN06169.1 glycosyltransferase family 1 protein [Rhodohalobacter mucosus]